LFINTIPSLEFLRNKYNKVWGFTEKELLNEFYSFCKNKNVKLIVLNKQLSKEVFNIHLNHRISLFDNVQLSIINYIDEVQLKLCYEIHCFYKINSLEDICFFIYDRFLSFNYIIDNKIFFYYTPFIFDFNNIIKKLKIKVLFYKLFLEGV